MNAGAPPTRTPTGSQVRALLRRYLVRGTDERGAVGAAVTTSNDSAAEGLRRALDLLPDDGWRVVHDVPIGRRGDVVAIAVGAPGIHVVHLAHARHRRPRDQRPDRRRRLDLPVRAVERQLSLVRTRLSAELGRIAVVRGLVVLPDVHAEPRTVSPDIEVLALVDLPRRLILAQGGCVEPAEITALGELAARPWTWAGARSRRWGGR